MQSAMAIGFLLAYRVPLGDRAVADRAVHSGLFVMRFVREVDRLGSL